MADNVYWIWFQLLFGVGIRRAELLLNYFENPREIYEGIQSGGRVAGMLATKELAAAREAMEQAREIESRTLKKGVDIVTPSHPNYPERLQNIYAKPAVLYVKGDLGCLKNALTIAMVGTRNFTEYGAKAACMLAERLAQNGAVVVSGLAKGIDTHCHAAALEAGGKSIGVLGCGIDIDYPSGSAKLKRAMCENGAVVTEYPLGTEPRPSNFPMRNRILSGMCHGVVVVEADLKSGSLITANHAAEQGRDVFAVPGSIFSMREQGTHYLIKEGAKLTESVDDILAEYAHTGLVRPGAFVRPKPPIHTASSAPAKNKEDAPSTVPVVVERKILPDTISEHCAVVYALVEAQPVSVEQIAESVQMEMGAILSALTELELYGLILGYPGRRFGLYYSGGDK